MVGVGCTTHTLAVWDMSAENNLTETEWQTFWPSVPYTLQPLIDPLIDLLQKHYPVMECLNRGPDGFTIHGTTRFATQVTIH
jgi:hypothetical protein